MVPPGTDCISPIHGFFLFGGAMFFFVLALFFEESRKMYKTALLSLHKQLISKGIGEYFTTADGKQNFRLTP